MPPKKRSVLSHVDPHSESEVKSRASSRLPSATAGANLLNSVRIKSLAPRGDIYDFPESPERRASLPEMVEGDQGPSEKKRKERIQQQPSQTPIVEAHPVESSVEATSSKKQKTKHTQEPSFPSNESNPTASPLGESSTQLPPIESLSVKTELAIRSSSTGRTTRSTAHAVPESVQSTAPRDSTLVETAEAKPSISAVAPEDESSEHSPERSDGTSEESDGLANESRRGRTSDDAQANSQRIGIPSVYDGIFSFIDSSRRAGKCQSELGAQIKEICKQSRLAIPKPGEEESAKTLTTITSNIRAVLLQVDSLEDYQDQLDFKYDAYAYVFRALALYLQDLYATLCAGRNELPETAEALGMIYPFVRDIIYFKDVISSWKRVKVTSRYKGDRFVRDTESNFIAPLRELVEELRLPWNQLKEDEKRQRTSQVHLREHERRVQEQNRQEEVRESEIAWKKYWYHLHIRRMQCEPNIQKRKQHLEFVEAPDLTERDSNGIPIERVSGLGHRTNPPPRWLSSDEWEGKEWAEVEDAALLETLQKFPGPGVFDTIFQAHCRPGGVLRDFNVSEIFARAVWLRARWISCCRDKGWGEPPAWVKQIPLPSLP